MAHLIQFPKHQIEEIHPKCPEGHGAWANSNGKTKIDLHEEVEHRMSGQLSHEVAPTLGRTVQPGLVESHAEENGLDDKNYSIDGQQTMAICVNCAKAISREYLIHCYTR
jgi:hypothetical protein